MPQNVAERGCDTRLRANIHIGGMYVGSSFRRSRSRSAHVFFPVVARHLWCAPSVFRMAPKRRQSPTTVRDAVGMTIPEARLRRDRISYERFDEEVGQASRDLLGVEELAVDVEEPSLRARASSICCNGGNPPINRAVRRGRGGGLHQGYETGRLYTHHWQH